VAGVSWFRMPKTYRNLILNNVANQLLAALPADEYEQLAPGLETVFLKSGQILYEPNEPITEVYFPQYSAISLVSIMENGATTEVGLTGCEGFVGLPVIWGGQSMTNRAIVQIPGSAFKLPIEKLLYVCQPSTVLFKYLLLYTQALFCQVSQTAACNRQHAIEERLARWLLSAQDCVQQNELELTQEFISNMLGINRPGVTIAAGILQRAGLIRYRRGRITVLDRSELEASSCECYPLVKAEYQRLVDLREDMGRMG
jgi:CRP-like cAMP-binding protein